MKKKTSVTSGDAPHRRETDRKIDPGFGELLDLATEHGAGSSVDQRKPTSQRKRKSVDGVDIVAQTQPSRERAPSDQNVTFFRGIPKTLNSSIHNFAAEINFPVGIAARLLLELGIKEYREGNLPLVPQPSWKGLSLYPTSGNRVGRPASPKDKKPVATTPIAFRGIPESTIKALESVKKKVPVPKGEIARRFFEHSLSLYKKGRLNIPDPVAWMMGRVTIISVEESTEDGNSH